MRTISVVNNKLMVETDTHINSYEINSVYLNHKLKVGNKVNPTNTIRMYTVSPDIDVLEMIEIYNEGTFKHFYVVHGSTTAEKNGVVLTPSFIDWYNEIKSKKDITVSVNYHDGKVIFSGPLMQRVVCPPFVHYTKIINKSSTPQPIDSYLRMMKLGLINFHSISHKWIVGLPLIRMMYRS